MKQYSFLDESFNSFYRRLSRYTPEEQKRIVNRLIKVGKKNGGLYSADEYGSKMLDGQWKRIQNIASQNDRKIVRNVVSDPLQSGILPARNIDSSYNRHLDGEQLRNYRHNVRGVDVAKLPSQVLGKQSPLEKAHIASHEADEYSLMFSNARRLKIVPELSDELNYKHNLTSKGKHHLGVLKRERKRSDQLATVYGTKFKERDVDELQHNSVALKTLLKYLGSIKNREKLLSGKASYEKNLEILKKQRRVIEDFLRRRDEIMKMPDGLRKSVKLQTLKNDIEAYNLKLPTNRRVLKLDL